MMDDNSLNEFADYWGKDADEFLLVSSKPDSSDLSHCLILHQESRCYEAIEDSELALEVMTRMQAAGVPVVYLDDIRK